MLALAVSVLESCFPPESNNYIPTIYSSKFSVPSDYEIRKIEENKQGMFKIL